MQVKNKEEKVAMKIVFQTTKSLSQFLEEYCGCSWESGYLDLEALLRELSQKDDDNGIEVQE